jgi:hypothetical protein
MSRWLEISFGNAEPWPWSTALLSYSKPARSDPKMRCRPESSSSIMRCACCAQSVPGHSCTTRTSAARARSFSWPVDQASPA